MIPCDPDDCRRCGGDVDPTDSDPIRHQFWDLPAIQPIVTEYQLKGLMQTITRTLVSLAKEGPLENCRQAPRLRTKSGTKSDKQSSGRRSLPGSEHMPPQRAGWGTAAKSPGCEQNQTGMTPVALLPMESSPQDIVHQQLEAVSTATGVIPRPS